MKGRKNFMYEKCEIENMLKEYLKSKSQLEELESKIRQNQNSNSKVSANYKAR